jgi:hypothetical protein
MNFKLWLEKIIEQPNPFNPLAKKPRKFIVSKIPEDKSKILKNLRYYLGFLIENPYDQKHLEDFKKTLFDSKQHNFYNAIKNVQTKDINKDLLDSWKMTLDNELIS